LKSRRDKLIGTLSRVDQDLAQAEEVIATEKFTESELKEAKKALDGLRRFKAELEEVIESLGQK
jgi:hypothetical protein